MPEARNFVFSHAELAEILVKKLDIHEGLWGIYIEFSFAATNIGTSPDSKSIAPAAVAAVKTIGIQRFDAANNVTVDAAVVNPVTTH